MQAGADWHTVDCCIFVWCAAAAPSCSGPHGARRSAGSWSLVGLEGSGAKERQGWIQHTGLIDPGSGEAPSGVFTARPRRSPPALELEAAISAKGALVTSARTFTVSGSARYAPAERGRRYVYIFRGDDKVFFRSGSPGDADPVLPFQTEIPLDPGRNVLSIIARQGKRDVTRRSVVIYRDAKSEER